MRQYKRLSKAQISALALGALAAGSLGVSDTFASTTQTPELEAKTELSRPISESDSVENLKEQKRTS